MWTHDDQAFNPGECAVLDDYITQLDADARQSHSSQHQDALRRERRQARNRQAQLRC